MEFCVGQYLHPPTADNTHELKTSDACAKIDQEILHNVWQEVEYRFDVARATCRAHIELY
jgi:hypothetical protein